MMKSFGAGKHTVIFLFILIISCTSRYPGPLSPMKSLERMELREGFKIELLASEPLIHDPVCMEFDEQGNIYVVEMPDYPYRPEPGKQKGKIIQLKDNNDDGIIDQSMVFADSLMEATSILPWKGGLLVTTAPYILYLKDTTGDGRSDLREILFSGFFAKNSEAQITSLSYGVDNWIYAANNGQAGEVTSTRNPDIPPLAMSGADFRFRMDRNEYEPTTGSGQFGQTLDDWGNRFITQNTLHIQHTVIPWKYWHRHPYLPSFKASANISDHDLEMFQKTPPPYWRAERTRHRNKDFKERALDRVEYAEDHFTGASGGTIYAGDAFPKEYYGNIFTGDVAGNLVHRDVISTLSNTPTFVAKRDNAEKNREFLASTDTWFRPVNFSQGPDGNLYVLDYYRQHIETPVSIPDDLKKEMDFLNGSTLGRIYRISPANVKANEKKVPDLQKKSTIQLVELLSHPGRWWRLQARRLLLERQDSAALPALRTLFEQSNDATVRLHALYAIEGLNALTVELVLKALKDDAPGMREHGLILSERFPDCLAMALSKLDDSSNRVAFQSVLTIGDFHGEKVVHALAKAVQKYGQDPWFQTAVLSSVDGSSLELLKLLMSQNFFSTIEDWKFSFIESFSYITGARNKKEQINFLLQALSKPDIMKEARWQTAVVNGLAKGIKKSSTSDSIKDAFTRIASDSTANANDKLRQLSLLISGDSKL